MRFKACLKLAVGFLTLVCSLWYSSTPTRATEQVYFLHQDHLGSTTLTSKEDGTSGPRQVYYPYGSTRAISSTLPTEKQYTGQVSDQLQTGLYYYNARYYNPQTAKFNQADTNEGPNRYVYTANNPIKYIDPTGNSRCVPGTLFYMHNCQDGSGESESSSGQFEPTSTVTPTFTATPVFTPTSTATPKPTAKPKPQYKPLAHEAFNVLGSNSPRGADLDPSKLVYNPIPRAPGYDYPYIGDDVYSHRIDRRAPQLGTLVEGMTQPKITETYRIKGANIPLGVPGEFANLVAFQAGKNKLLLPQSGYDIGSGFSALVLNADKNSLVLKYTGEDSIVYGYTLYLEGIKVNPSILNDYQLLSSKGRKQLPALLPGEFLGVALNGTILLGIRDTGTWMDPRWLQDWWN